MYARRVVAATRPAPLFKRSFALAALGANATFARASTAYVTDYQGVLREAPIDTPRFDNARVVYNQLGSIDFAIEGGNWSEFNPNGTVVTPGFPDPDGGNTAYRIAIPGLPNSGLRATLTAANSYLAGQYACASVWLRSDAPVTVRLWSTATADGGAIAANVTTQWKRFSASAQAFTIPTKGLHILNAADGSPATVYAWRPQNERVSAASSPCSEWVGANLLGSFATTNGNTVDDNGVVTEGTGTAIAGIAYLDEPASTNYFLGSFAPATQSVTRAGTHTVSCRGTGSVTLSGGLTGTVTEGNPITGDPGGVATLCTCSGSLAYVQFEPGSVATSPISTTASPVSRAADSLSYSGIPPNNETRVVVDGANSDTDDWDGVVDEVGRISRILVYAPGQRP